MAHTLDSHKCPGIFVVYVYDKESVSILRILSLEEKLPSLRRASFCI